MCKLTALACSLVPLTFLISVSEAATPVNHRSISSEASNSGSAKHFDSEFQDDKQYESQTGTADSDAPAPPMADPTGIMKNRFVSFSIPQPGITALKVTLVSLHHVDPPYSNGATVPFAQFEGQSLYVGPPTRFVESRASALPFYSSNLQCEPHYQDWSTLGLLHVSGEAVVPSSIYDVQSLSESCRNNEDDCPLVSTPLTLETARWGDIVDIEKTGAAELPDFVDIASLVAKFKDLPGAPRKPVALLAGVNERGAMNPGFDLNITHVSVVVDAFMGRPYPYKPGKCSHNSAMSCLSDDECSHDDPMAVCLLCGDVTGGACCHGDGTCDIMPESACNGMQDTYHGDGMPCSRCCGPSAGCVPLTDAEWLEAQQSWPNLIREDVCKEAEVNRFYNCVAWVIGNTRLSIWIDINAAIDDGIWPLADFEEFIDRYQKPAIVYGTSNDSILHTAIPLPNHCASSKVGIWIRMRHDRIQLQGGAYGHILATYVY